MYNSTFAWAANTTGGQELEEEEDDDDDEGLECEEGFEVQERDLCFLNTYDTMDKKIRGACEVTLIIWSFIYIGIAVHERTFLGHKLFWENLKLCPSRCGFLMGCFCILFAIPFRLTCQPDIEENLAITAMTFISFYFLFFCRGFKTTGPFVTMIYRMTANDLLRFVIIYIIFVMGFAQSYFIIFQSWIEEEASEEVDENPMPTPIESFLRVFVMSLGIFGDVWEGLEATDHSAQGKVCMFIFLAIAYIMLVNLLIAMMGDTYTKIAEIKNEWMRQWARTVLIVERCIAPEERLRQQNLYSERMATGEKALVLKQTMSMDQLDEIKDIIEMKVSHRKNINRRRDRFGYESNSLIGLDLGSANVIAPDAEDEENPFET